MSYAVTDAVEQDMRVELSALRELNEELDQMANPKCESLCPDLAAAIAIAWWLTEDAIRTVTGTCSAHSDGHCPCCKYYAEIAPKVRAWRRA